MAARARTCRPPRAVSVRGHWRQLTGRKRKRKRPRLVDRPAPRHPYWVAVSRAGKRCTHHHRTLNGAHRCAIQHERQERVNRARYLTRKQARKQRVMRWDAVRITP